MDTFVPTPDSCLQIVGDPGKVLPLLDQLQAVCSCMNVRPVALQPLERIEFHAAAKKSFAIIRTADSGPYGCFIKTKGLINWLGFRRK